MMQKADLKENCSDYCSRMAPRMAQHWVASRLMASQKPLMKETLKVFE